MKSALLRSLEVKGIESTIIGGLAYDAEWALIDSYLEQGHSVILIVHVYPAFNGSKTPPQNSAKAKKLGGD